jgi:hypothetical protein
MSNGNYLVVNDYGIAIVADPIYFVAAVPGLDKAFSPTEDGKIYYDGPIIPDSGKPLNRRK